MHLFFTWTCAVILGGLTLIVAYEWVLAIVSLAAHQSDVPTGGRRRTRFVILVPAHDEERHLAKTVRSLQHLDYPNSRTRIVVVADHCTDATAASARACGVVCLERRNGPHGKGAAIAWGIDELERGPAAFDAVVIVDADAVADRALLDAFDAGLHSGHEVQQAYNYLSNPWATAFTRIISVTSILRNGLYYVGKERLGLPAMLTGNGMCFSRRILRDHRWSAFSVGEDWEFSIALLLHGEHIHFTRRARVCAAESQNFRQASSQRLRWATGRHAVAATSAIRLLRAGVVRRRFDLWDAALTILAPTYSAQAALTGLCLAGSWVATPTGGSHLLQFWSVAVAGLLTLYFAVGIVLTEAPGRALLGVAAIPAFVPWRVAIEVLGVLGYGRDRWIRTSRADSD